MQNPRFLFFISFLFTSCTSFNVQKNFKDETIFSVDGHPVSAEEFIYVYEKNNFNNEDIYSQSDVLDYLDLFVNFKLKVRQAKAEGIDTTQSFKNEFESYQSELIKPYLLETRETDSLARQAYQRMKYFVHASHILVSIKDGDTLQAYQRMVDIKKQLKEGQDFNELAKMESDDPSAKQNNGDLGFFTAMSMVYPFENAAYSTPVGQVSDILQTQFGYHILKVHEKVENKGKIQIAHIVITKAQNKNPEEKAFEIYDKIVTDGDWDYFCQQYSEDQQTKDKGGVLNYFGQGQLPPNFHEFEEKVFSLDSIGIVSGPIESPYGWHIVKVMDIKPLESFDELKESLKSQATRGERAKVKKEIVLARLKKAANYSKNEPIFQTLANLPDSVFINQQRTPTLPDTLLQKKLFSLNNDDYSVQQFFGEASFKKGASFESIYNDLVSEKLYAFEKNRIREEHIEYRMLEKEYHEGLMLFDIMDKYVWGKSAIDSAEIANYFEENSQNYQWDERLKATIFETNRPEVADDVYTKLSQDSIIYFKKQFKPTDLNQALDEISNLLADFPDSKIALTFSNAEPSSINIDSIREMLTPNFPINNISITNVRGMEESLQLCLSSNSPTALGYLYNKNSQLELNIKNGLFEKKDHPVFENIDWNPGIYKVKDSAQFVIVEVEEIFPPRSKKLDEIKGLVISDYQKDLEDSWVNSLKKKYPVVKNEDVITKTLKYFEKK